MTEHGPSVAIFVSQITALLICGKIMSELLQRIGQPAVMGQLLAGVLLGPSVLGYLLPDVSHALFPNSAAQKAMLDAVAQLGILLLLLLTGMETDLSIVRNARRTAVSISLMGILIPFGCGVALGELLPDSLLPDPGKRLITTLFLGTALAISSVKIVALVVRDLGFLRRSVGQVIIAAAIIDDTIGWIIMSVTFGLALHGGIDIPIVARSVLGTLVFLALSFTVGRRLVFRVIRWANDHLISELGVISVILAITGLMALLTNAIGVHLVLGAFVAGILTGQSPILTRQIAERLRGMIVALFMPVFFGLAGLTTDLAVLARPDMLLLTAGLIGLASLGKFSGAFLGGRLGGLNFAESLAVGCGMNARGSTEVIVATIGLSMGTLNESLFSAIVAMAVVTTMAMPPMLRWALRRLPMGSEDRARLEREEFEAQGFVRHIERLLVVVDGSASGQLASRLAGLLSGVRGISTTVLHFDVGPATGPAADSDSQGRAQRTAETVRAGADAGNEAATDRDLKAEITTRTEAPQAAAEVIAAEAKKGYGLLFLGREPTLVGNHFDPQITRSVSTFGGPFAIAIARGESEESGAANLAPTNILVPITGTRVSRDAAEIAIALAQAVAGSVTALVVNNPVRTPSRWRDGIGAMLSPQDTADAAIREITQIGEHYGIEIKGRIRTDVSIANAIGRELEFGHHDLLAMGVSPRTGAELFFGELTATVLARAELPVLLIASEGPAAQPSRGHDRSEGDPAARADRSLPKSQQSAA